MNEEDVYEGHGGPPRGDQDESKVMPESVGREGDRKAATAGMATDTGDPAGLPLGDPDQDQQKKA